MTDAPAAVSPLRRRMIDDMSLRNLSPATQRSYLHAVTKFSRYFGHSPDRLGLEDVRAFQVYLVSQGISWPSLNQTVCALRFFYGITRGCKHSVVMCGKIGEGPLLCRLQLSLKGHPFIERLTVFAAVFRQHVDTMAHGLRPVELGILECREAD